MEAVASCCKCKRLSDYRSTLKQQFPDYYCLPVESFGVSDPGLLIVGLAPGKHGANASGRAFTGDASGNLLFETLYQFGFASLPHSLSVDDGMTLNDCRITNAVRCLPPQNRPLPDEINRCNPFLQQEIAALSRGSVLLALGAIAHRAIIKSQGLAQKQYPFAHGARHGLDDGLTLVDSYHCSRYNTQTRRLTSAMFEQVFADIKTLLDHD